MQRKQRVIYYFICFFVFVMFGGCATGRGAGAVVSDFGNGASEYLAIQGDIREGETELAITGAAIEYRSEHIASGLNELERSISSSQGAEQEIDAIILRVRARPVDPSLIEEWRNRQAETNGSGRDSGDGEI